MKHWITAFLLLGVITILSGITGISSFSSTVGGPAVVGRYPDAMSRVIAGVHGSALIFMAWSMYRRRPWVWRGMFVLFGVAILESVSFVWRDLARESTGDRIAIVAIAILGFAAVAAYWSFRWYKFRPHFFPDEHSG
jgi:hypothetical protein